MGVLVYTEGQRLLAFLAKCRPVPTGCIEWTGALWFGYGRFGAGGRRTCLAHRWSYERWAGPLLPGMEIDHLCRNTRCVRPSHLEQVTREINQARAIPYERTPQTHCKHGHKFSPENTRVDSGGRRHCRTCDKGHAQRRDRRGERQRVRTVS